MEFQLPPQEQAHQPARQLLQEQRLSKTYCILWMWLCWVLFRILRTRQRSKFSPAWPSGPGWSQSRHFHHLNTKGKFNSFPSNSQIWKSGKWLKCHQQKFIDCLERHFICKIDHLHKRYLTVFCQKYFWIKILESLQEPHKEPVRGLVLHPGPSNEMGTLQHTNLQGR